ncbi:Histone-lysine N-methyltransferase ASHR2 [Chlorella sorokiniana]|uniref:Histone-lysine N-methyltransferase ASHR2 n=1 Tax=Chlorella sorokiniana TaxID=3076 RepID=A0A2P6THG2_CHLSO|nr:Histone-lysine N-methyltransferase ASHR2 [Chlorella sorokiniana]|eukprot:PRW33731.1 Histone-lysine N-methyltransferase ASHR2 [Chlorella sorokiniana]
MAALEAKDVPGKGRGAVAAHPIRGGETVLAEQPLLLWPQHSTAAAFCSHCLRAFNSLTATPNSLLAACNINGLSDEQQSALQLLFRCCSLRAAAAAGDTAAAARLAGIAALAAPPPLPPQDGEGEAAAAASVSSPTSLRELHGRLSHALAAVNASPAAALSLEEVTELLRRDAVNGYGIMAPSAPDGERRIRGTGLYSQASLINHECLPSVARFDRFDAPPAPGAPPGVNTAVEFRAMHDIPAGEEVCQSYFPLPWSMRERQERCREDYAFCCTCPRCQEEATWSESEWETDDDAGMADAAAAGGQDGGAAGTAAGHDGGACSHGEHGGAQQAEQAVDAGYINIFLLKYVCPRSGCYGTLAPAAPGADVLECNMCGGRRSEAEFLAELEAAD